MKLRRATSFIGVLTLVIAGCTTGRAPQQFHLLNAAPATGLRLALTHAGPGVLVAPTTAASFYDAQAIVYSRARDTRAYYQLNSWTEPPSRRISALLTERLTDSGAYATVATVTEGIDGRLLLSTHIDELYHDAQGNPGAARIALTAVLSDPMQRTIVAQRRFTSSAPVSRADAKAAVAAFDVALASMLDDIVQWVAQSTTQMQASR